MFISKQAKQKAFESCARDLYFEFLDLEEKMKFILFTQGHCRSLRELKRKHAVIKQAMRYQHSESYFKKLRRVANA